MIPAFGCQTCGQNFVSLGNVTVGVWPLKFSSFWNFGLLPKPRLWPLEVKNYSATKKIRRNTMSYCCLKKKEKKKHKRKKKKKRFS
jgi:hypothetical protein